MDLFNALIFQPIFNVLILLYNLVGDMGLAIIALTVIVRIILLPLANKAMRSQRRLQALSPELKKIQEKHKDNRELMAQELMKFYRQEKVSPASSCLPLLVQIPVLIALFFVFKDAVAGTHLDQLYEFVKKPDTVDPTFLGFLDLSKPDRFVLPALAAVFQYLQSRMLMPKDSAAMPAMNRQIILLFPILTFVVATTLPAALPLYWATSTLFMLGQQYVIIREMPVSQAKAEGVADWNKANPSDAIPAKTGRRRSKKGPRVTVRKRGE